MSQWILPSDGVEPYTMAQRWERCSPEAKKFAAYFGGRWAPMLPHIVAEMYDRGEIGIESLPEEEPGARA